MFDLCLVHLSLNLNDGAGALNRCDRKMFPGPFDGGQHNSMEIFNETNFLPQTIRIGLIDIDFYVVR